MNTVLVTAATGRQGGATARSLLAGGKHRVRALVRDLEAPKAKALAAAGAELVKGDLDDPASLRAACEGVSAVFSMQSPPMTATGVDHSKEVQQGINLIEAAKAAGVETFVHTSTSGVGDHRTIEGWAEGRWKANETYWENKLATVERVRSAGFKTWTIILPSTFMDHSMLDPAGFVGGKTLLTTVKADRAIPLIAPEDVGHAAAAAISDPEKFHGVTLQLAGELKTLNEVAAVLSKRDGVSYEVRSLSIDDAIAEGMHPALARGLTFMNVAPVLARPELARALGLQPMSFEAWATSR